ncbi:MAG: VWA domain-containing protein, partial [Flavobacteriales bacterium]
MKKLLFSFMFSLVLGVGFSQCGCTKLVFIIDNSGSVSTTEFTDMKRSIDTISAQLLRQYPGSEITVLQYASQNATNHTYAISVPFTTNTTTAQTWSRAYATGGTVNSGYFQDHLPGSLEKMRRDSIWYAGKSVDLITGACNTRVFLFTDAAYGGTGCCSHLINNGLATLALPNYGEYNLHKSTFLSEWTVYHVTFGTNTTAQQAGAAISSKGGSYAGTRALNPGDPQGAGGPRKYYSFAGFQLSQQNVDTALANINAGSFSAQFPNDTICLGDSARFS